MMNDATREDEAFKRMLAWAAEQGFSTGHADNLSMLLDELLPQLEALFVKHKWECVSPGEYETLSCPFCAGEVDWCQGEDDEVDHECHHLVCENGHFFDLSGDYDAETTEELRRHCLKVFRNRPMKTCGSDQYVHQQKKREGN